MAHPAQLQQSEGNNLPLRKEPAHFERCLFISTLCILLIGALATYFCWSELGLSALGISGGALALALVLNAIRESRRPPPPQINIPKDVIDREASTFKFNLYLNIVAGMNRMEIGHYQIAKLDSFVPALLKEVRPKYPSFTCQVTNGVLTWNISPEDLAKGMNSA